MAQGKRSVILRIMAALLVLLVACGAVLGTSALRMRQSVEQAQQAYEAYAERMDNADVTGAVASLQDLAKSMGELEEEANEWQWQLVSALPVVGNDVLCARGTATIASTLANDALIPVLSDAQGILADLNDMDFADLDLQDLGKLGSVALKHTDQVVELAKAIAEAEPVVESCRESANELPTSHFKELNDLVDNIRSACKQADDALKQINSLTSFFI